ETESSFCNSKSTIKRNQTLVSIDKRQYNTHNALSFSRKGHIMRGDSLGIAVIGSGRAGMIHARNFAAGVGGAKLAVMVDPVAETRKAALAELGIEKGYSDYRDALDDPKVGAVVVVTPTVLHRGIVVAAAAAGKHVFCEKPMAMDATECADMIAACDRAGVKLQIGFMRRYARDFV